MSGVLLLAGILVLLTPLVGNALGNLYLVATANGYFVPEESSLFSFVSTEEVEGNGEWWVRGEDRSTFFALGYDVYWSFPKSKVRQCQGFDVNDHRTWCAPHVTARPIPRTH